MDSNIVDIVHQRAFRASSARAMVVELVLQMRAEEQVEAALEALGWGNGGIRRGLRIEARRGTEQAPITYPNVLNMSNNVLMVVDVNELGNHSVNSFLTTFGLLLPIRSVTSSTSSTVMRISSSLLAPCKLRTCSMMILRPHSSPSTWVRRRCQRCPAFRRAGPEHLDRFQ